MSNNKVSNEQIYELLQSQENRLCLQEQRTDQMLDLLKEFKNDTKTEFSEIKLDIRDMRRKLDSVYDERRQVEISFTRSWAMASFFIAISASILTAFFIKAL